VNRVKLALYSTAVCSEVDLQKVSILALAHKVFLEETYTLTAGVARRLFEVPVTLVLPCTSGGALKPVHCAVAGVIVGSVVRLLEPGRQEISDPR